MSSEERNYYNDRRIRAAQRSKWYSSFDEARMVATVEVEEPDDEILEFGNGRYDPEESDSFEVQVNVVYEICVTCAGRGSHVNPSIDASGLTREDFDQDPQFEEEYRSGLYDVTCYECKGKRVIVELDRQHTRPEIVNYLDDQAEREAEEEREHYYERMNGA